MALLRSDLESKERDLESQCGEAERLRRVEEQLGQLEQAEASEVGRLRTLVSALAGNLSFLPCVCQLS